MAKFKEKLIARKLRKQGESIKEIAKKVNVSASTVSLWCSNIRLSKQQIEQLEQRARDPFYGKRLLNVMRQKKEKEKRIIRQNKAGLKRISSLNTRELLIAGTALYWAEGFKKDNQVGFGSSDPKMINFFIKWLRDCFGYKNEDLALRITANISHKHRIKEIEKYWSETTNIPQEQFQKPFFQNVKWKKVYENPNDYFGVLRIRVRKSTNFLRFIMGMVQGMGNQA